MRTSVLLGSTLLAATFGTLAGAHALRSETSAVEIVVGDKAPSISAKKLHNTKFKSLDQLKGRLILLEFFAHW